VLAAERQELLTTHSRISRAIELIEADLAARAGGVDRDLALPHDPAAARRVSANHELVARRAAEASALATLTVELQELEGKIKAGEAELRASD
jgi:hypothetical protein